MKGKRVAAISLLTALSLISFMLENLFPSAFIPGARLGIGNIFVMIALIYYGFGDAVIIMTAKCVLSCMYGGFSQIIYNFPSGLVSVVAMYALLKLYKSLSIISISAASAVIHNLVQNLVFCFATKSSSVLLYSPYLALLGLISGVFTGLVTYLFIKYIAPKLNKIQINNDKENI